MSSVPLSVSVIVGIDGKGHPTLKASGCSLHIGHLDVHFHGGSRQAISNNRRLLLTDYLLYNFMTLCVCVCVYSWLYNLFASSIAGSLKDSIIHEVQPC